MSWYYELPIRCFICGTPVSAKAGDFYGLLDSGYDVAQALDEMNINTTHCRAAFQGPTVRWFNGEVASVVDGTIKISEYTPTSQISVATGRGISAPVASSRTIGLGLGIPQQPIQLGTGAAQKEFSYPTEVGKPTYNPDPAFPQEVVNVGGNRKVKVRMGQTYLAR